MLIDDFDCPVCGEEICFYCKECMGPDCKESYAPEDCSCGDLICGCCERCQSCGDPCEDCGLYGDCKCIN